MEKPASLRRVIENALPDLKANPDKFNMWVVSGNVLAQKGTLGHTTDYRLNINIESLPVEKVEWVHIAIIDWAQVWQPDLLGQGHTEPARFQFEVNLLENDTADLAVVLRLTEGVVVEVDESTNSIQKIVHRKPPQHYNDLTWPLLDELDN